MFRTTRSGPGGCAVESDTFHRGQAAGTRRRSLGGGAESWVPCVSSRSGNHSSTERGDVPIRRPTQRSAPDMAGSWNWALSGAVPLTPWRWSRPIQRRRPSSRGTQSHDSDEIGHDGRRRNFIRWPARLRVDRACSRFVSLRLGRPSYVRCVRATRLRRCQPDGEMRPFAHAAGPIARTTLPSLAACGVTVTSPAPMTRRRDRGAPRVSALPDGAPVP